MIAWRNLSNHGLKPLSNRKKNYRVGNLTGNRPGDGGGAPHCNSSMEIRHRDLNQVVGSQQQESNLEVLCGERISEQEAIDSPDHVRKRIKPSTANVLQDSVADFIKQKVSDAPAQEEGNKCKKQSHTDRNDPVTVDRDVSLPHGL